METFEPTLREFDGEDSESSDPASVDDRTKLADGAPGSLWIRLIAFSRTAPRSAIRVQADGASS
jgi:hypothetical protein